MRDNKYKIMELFVYILIVIIGIALLIFGKADNPLPEDIPSPPAVQTQSTPHGGEGGELIAFLLDEQ